jgi:hypothetical protein
MDDLKVSAENAFSYLRPYLFVGQLAALQQYSEGEESEYFRGVVVELAARIGSIPAMNEGPEVTNDSPAMLHYFYQGSDWYIFELEHVAEDDVVLGFGWAILGGDYQNAELGCISVSELLACGVELDLHFAPKTLGQVRLEHLSRINHGNASIRALMRDTPRIVDGRITYSIR